MTDLSSRSNRGPRSAGVAVARGGVTVAATLPPAARRAGGRGGHLRATLGLHPASLVAPCAPP